MPFMFPTMAFMWILFGCNKAKVAAFAVSTKIYNCFLNPSLNGHKNKRYQENGCKEEEKNKT